MSSFPRNASYIFLLAALNGLAVHAGTITFNYSTPDFTLSNANNSSHQTMSGVPSQTVTLDTTSPTQIALGSFAYFGAAGGNYSGTQSLTIDGVTGTIDQTLNTGSLPAIDQCFGGAPFGDPPICITFPGPALTTINAGTKSVFDLGSDGIVTITPESAAVKGFEQSVTQFATVTYQAAPLPAPDSATPEQLFSAWLRSARGLPVCEFASHAS